MHSSYSAMKAARPSRRETSVYASIAAAVIVASVITISYLDGRAADAGTVMAAKFEQGEGQ